MKLGYICVGPLLQHYGIEGGAIHIQEVCNALQRLGHDVFVIAGKRPLISENIKVYDLSISSLLPFARLRYNMRTMASRVWHKLRIDTPSSFEANKSIDLKDLEPNFTTLSWSLILFWNDIRRRMDDWEYDRYFYHRACQIIETEQPDVLYERGIEYAGLHLSQRYGLPLILEMNGSHTFRREWRHKHSRLYPWMIRRWERRSCHEADSVAVVTPFLKQYLARLGIPGKKVFLLPNGVDTGKFYPDDLKASAIRQKYGLEGKIVVGFIGGLRLYHGVDILIDSARAIVKESSDIHFLIVGDGPPRATLEQQARKRGVASVVTFTGSVPYQDMPVYINAMDVTVAPFSKLPDFHFSPIKIFEYMAVAKPVVASRYTDTESVIVDRYNGLLVEPGNRHQLACAIQELLQDKDLRRRLGREGRRTVEEKYTWEKNAQMILEIYENLRQSKQS